MSNSDGRVDIAANVARMRDRMARAAERSGRALPKSSPVRLSACPARDAGPLHDPSADGRAAAAIYRSNGTSPQPHSRASRLLKQVSRVSSFAGPPQGKYRSYAQRAGGKRVRVVYFHRL